MSYKLKYICVHNQQLLYPDIISQFQWNISDYFYQNRERIKTELNKSKQEADTKVTDRSGDAKITDRSEVMTAFDGLWMCLFMRLGDLCVDSRPAVRKSAGQTLFSTISTHGGLLEQASWKKVLWKVCSL